MENLFIDGVLYVPYEFKAEAELERQIQEHSQLIFGENTFFLPKKKIKSLSGIKSIPDGFVLDLARKRWFVIEIELATHQIFEHIVPQISKFAQALNNHEQRNRLADTFFEWFESDTVLKATIEKILQNRELFRFLTKLLAEKPIVVIIINRKTPELTEVLSSLPLTAMVLEFNTYIRSDVNDTRVHAHRFDTIFEEHDEKMVEEKQVIRRRRNFGLKESEYFIPILSALKKLGGEAKVKSVINEVFEMVKDKLTAQDLEPVKSGKEPIWRNRVMWAKNTLKNKGFLRGVSFGIWAITPEGEKWLAEQTKHN